MSLTWILISTFLVSLISFIGLFSFVIKEKLLKKILLFLIALSAGGLMGGAFLHLIPESTEKFTNHNNIYLYVLFGFILFFATEKVLYWRHCHERKCTIHTFAYMNILGDGVHNFIDGLIIAASYITNIQLGIITTLAVGLHEIPQEIGDFGVLVYGGFKKIKALILNFICALIAILGGLFGYFLHTYVESIIFLLPFAAGGFIYIAASDLIPEIGKGTSLKNSLVTFFVFLLGIGIMLIVKFF
ncbi:MAG: ZIP family metal transporter [Candidatus Omnitrophica bacterium]|nr:ZIP family metal transporter [Candidatus Omnitrophota bacterium]